MAPPVMDQPPMAPPPMAPPVMDQPPMAPPPMAPPPMAPPVMDQPPMAPPPMAPPVMDQPPMAPPPMAPPVMDQSDNNFAESFLNRLRDSRIGSSNMMSPMPFFRSMDNTMNRPRLGLEGILGGFDRFRPPQPPRFGLPDGFRPSRRPFPPSFGESPMRNFREMRGIGLGNPFFGPRRQG
jgi:hypothetical protein